MFVDPETEEQLCAHHEAAKKLNTSWFRLVLPHNSSSSLPFSSSGRYESDIENAGRMSLLLLTAHFLSHREKKRLAVVEEEKRVTTASLPRPEKADRLLSSN